MSASRPSSELGSDVVRSAHGAERDPVDLKTRVAWLYFMEGMTQDAVASKLGLTRQRVLKILANARQDGTVQVRVTTTLSACVALERQLSATFGIQRCVVIPAPADESQLARLLGAATGAYVSETLQEGMNVGLGWGNTLYASLTNITIRNIRQVAAVSLIGGLTRASGLNPPEFTWRFADLVGADAYLLTAPVFVSDEEIRNTLLRQPGIADVLNLASRLDMALLSVGDLSPNCTVVRCGVFTREELADIRRAGGVADILCQFIDAEGRLLDHPFNRRVLAAYPPTLAKTPHLVLASGGWQKVEAIRAAIRMLRPRALITDQTAAEGLLTSAT